MKRLFSLLLALVLLLALCACDKAAPAPAFTVPTPAAVAPTPAATPSPAAPTATPIDDGVTLRTRSVMGVLLPRITAAPQTPHLPYPLQRSGPTLDEAYLKFYELKQLLIEMAEAQTAVYHLTEAMKKTQKRTNALRHIVLPGMDADVRRITAALEEKEREEYTRRATCSTTGLKR